MNVGKAKQKNKKPCKPLQKKLSVRQKKKKRSVVSYRNHVKNKKKVNDCLTSEEITSSGLYVRKKQEVIILTTQLNLQRCERRCVRSIVRLKNNEL